MPTPAWLVPALGGLSTGGLLGGKGDTSVSTSQQVAQSASVNVNPIISVSSPNAHIEPRSSLASSPTQDQTTDIITEQPDEWRSAVPGGFSLDSFLGGEPGPVLSTGYDTKQTTTGTEGVLSSIISPNMLLMAGVGLLIWVLFMK